MVCARYVFLIMLESPFHLIGSFPGPIHSPFEHGLFKVDIVVPEGYPFHPLQMRFITKVCSASVFLFDGRADKEGVSPECLFPERGHLSRHS